MTIPLTQRALLASKQQTIRPQLVLCVDGLETKFGLSTIYEYIRVGDPGLYINNYNGDPWYIGGLRPIDDQGPWISFDQGTTTKYAVQLQPDKGVGAGVGQFSVSMIDKNEAMSEIVSPGFVVDDLLGKFCKVQIGFDDTSYPEDFITIFRGFVESIDSGPGVVQLLLSSVDQKIRQQLYSSFTSSLSSPMTNITASASVSDFSGFQLAIQGPSGATDNSYSMYLRIDDELMLLTAIGGTSTVTRGQLGSVAVAHDSGATINTVARLQGNGLELTRKLMLSGWNGYWKTGVEVTNFVRTSPTELVSNCIFFNGVDIEEEYGLYTGEYITTSGASNGANNVTLKQISSITKTNDGSYMVVSGVSFVEESGTSATISFRSKWDSLPFGLKMTPQQVDLAEFDELYSTFLSSFDFDFRITDAFNAKDFIEQQILRPMAAYAVPRKGRASVGYHIGPLPGADILTLSDQNVENASKLKIRRSLTKNFVNQIEYQYEYDVIQNKTTKTKTELEQTSVDDFGVGVKGQVINSEGMRTSTAAETKIVSASNRLLNRYSRGAEWIDNVEVRFGDAFNREIGDIVLIDMAALKITDKDTGNREGTTRLFQIQNLGIDIKTGKITFNLVDTNFDTAARYCLISPSSKVQNGISNTVFNIKPSYSEVFGTNEYLKWQRFLPCSVTVRSPDGVTRNATREVLSIVGNTVTMASSLGFTPQANDIMTFTSYNDATGTQKAAYGFMRNTAPFDDGKNRYQML